jgi:hypothetical protein
MESGIVQNDGDKGIESLRAFCGPKEWVIFFCECDKGACDIGEIRDEGALIA